MFFSKENIARVHPSWRNFFEEQTQKKSTGQLEDFLAEEQRRGAVIYPSTNQVFAAFEQTALDQVKVVILGQDPYHGPGQAHGLSFSVPSGVSLPPSLKNIFKELKRDLNIPDPMHGSLTAWASQGVLLLNATLTVRESEPKSHYGRGWEAFTDEVIKKLCSQKQPIAFLLWGRSAFEKFQQINLSEKENNHLVLTAPHPSPLSAYTGFFGCAHFSKTNTYLNNMGLTQIDWKIF